MKTRISDIAQEANCSIATVSRVMNGTTYPVDSFVKKKIIDLSIANGFLPPFLRNVGKERYGVIGVIVPGFSNPYYSHLVKGIEQIAQKNDFSVFVTSSDRSTEKEYLTCRKLIKSGIDGLLISSMIEDNDLLTILSKIGFPVVRFSSTNDASNINSITYDYAMASRIAVSYLVDNGHSKIGFASAELSSPDRMNLYNGFKLALSEYGMELDPSNIYILRESRPDILEPEIGEILAEEIASTKEKPTGLFCLNDSIAFGIINTLTKKYKLRIPADMSIIGFDNLKTGEYITPPLTTIKQNADEIGRKGASMLINLINKVCVQKELYIKPELIVRQSVLSKREMKKG